MLLSLLCAAVVLKGQTQPYGQIDVADLKLTACDFEKGASAMVLFDKKTVSTENDLTIITRHKRIKILNDKGLDAANLTIGYYSKDHLETISDFQAQTINLNNNSLQFTPIDNSLIYRQAADKNWKTIKVSFPAAKSGSVVEYSYKVTIDFPGAISDWDFQGDIPVRYCELDTRISRGFTFKIFPRIFSTLEKNIKERTRGGNEDSTGTHYLWAVKNVPSFKDEPYTTCREDNIQNIRFFLFKTPFDNMTKRAETWPRVTGIWMNDPDTEEQLKKNLSDDDTLLTHAKLLSTDEEKIAFLFNKIKNIVKWNGKYDNDTENGVKAAWGKKLGNSAEINLTLYNFLRMAGIKCNPTYVTTRGNGKLETDLPGMDNFNTQVLTVTTRAKNTYILDASNKFNTYNHIPFNLLNCYALVFDPAAKSYEIKIIEDPQPLKKVVLITAQIKAAGKLEGTVHVLSTGNDKADNLQQYANLGEIKYKEELRNKDNNLKIISLKRENMEADSLPLNEAIDFQLDLTSSDENYIYVNPTVLTPFNSNPFLSENRQAVIDFGNVNSYSIKSFYKTPGGYKTESVPQGISMAMPDKSISFKRIVAAEEGVITIRYTIDFNRSIFTADEYPVIRDFYKKMYEMLNEQIVLKKI